jgi:hypothetical protein
MDLGMYVFMKASTWPDQIRRHGNKHDHPHWHYVDYPLKPPAFAMEPGPLTRDDIFYGISQCEKTISDPKADPETKAVHLSWLIHLVGDIHQPLHCVSLFNDSYPSGDKGGNDFYIKPSSKGIKLHSFWDGLLGTSGKSQAHVSYAARIEAEYPRLSLKELNSHKKPREWSLEGRQLAIDKAYLGGQLKGSRVADSASELPEGYAKGAKTVAERQAALAGYRPAEEINVLLK